MTTWHEEKLLVDGELVAAEGGATYDTISPSTEEVLGVAADARVGDAERAVAAAKRAFDTTEWSRDKELRRRCLRQLHTALQEHYDDLRDILVHEAGAPVSIIDGAQLKGPIDVVGWFADLLETYEFTEDLGDREAFGLDNHRWT